MMDSDKMLPYDSSIHRSLDAYLKESNRRRFSPAFIGIDNFKLLWDEGYIEPLISQVFIAGRNGKGPYLVLNKDELEDSSNARSTPNVLDGVVWSLQGRNRIPFPRN
jgi:hypothetical protein